MVVGAAAAAAMAIAVLLVFFYVSCVFLFLCGEQLL